MGTQTQRTPKTFRSNKGMAMVMMLILVPILMFLAMSFVDPIVRSFRSAANDQKTLLAKNVADSMFEVALWDSRGAGVGENVTSGERPITKEYDFGTATVRWSVMATPDITQDKLINDKYTIPSPGSGTAGDDYCSTAEPVVNDDSLDEALLNLGFNETEMLLLGDYTAFDWPCNWNKLREGENIVIPLYTEDEDGNVIHPFEIPNVNDFTLTVRPACDPSKATNRENEYENQVCNNNERYTLAGDAGIDDLTVIVLWEITGRLGDENGESVYLTHKPTGTIFNPKTALDVETINAKTHLTQDSTARKKIDSTNFDDRSIENFLSILYKPELKLLVVHTLRDNYQNTVPYLEYQFSSTYNPASPPISSTSKIVNVDVIIDGGYSTSISKIVGIAKSVSGFVIQQ